MEENHIQHSESIGENTNVSRGHVKRRILKGREGLSLTDFMTRNRGSPFNLLPSPIKMWEGA